MKNFDDKMEKLKTADRSMNKIWRAICEFLEYVCVALVFVAVIITFVHLIPELMNVFTGEGTAELITFLEDVLTLAVGIEFMKLFAKPSVTQVLETIVFLVSRHMLVADPTAMETLLSSLSIVILVIAYVAVRILARKMGEDEAAPAEKEV